LDVVTSFSTNLVEHLLFTSDSHLALVARLHRWIIDSGAIEHITGDRSLLENIESLNPVNKALEPISHGLVSLITSRKENVRLSRVPFVPGLGCNLTSVP
jgi:hypothetical protein